MKRLLYLISTVTLISTGAFAQKSSIPAINVKNLDASVINTNDIRNDGSPIIISFWATWCKPCVNELNAINEIYEDMVDETGVKLIAISIDDARTMPKVAPFVNGKDWDFDIYLDPNHDFKRAMNVNFVPHTFLINGNREIVRQHTSYAPGDEDKLFDLVRKVSKGESIEE